MQKGVCQGLPAGRKWGVMGAPTTGACHRAVFLWARLDRPFLACTDPRPLEYKKHHPHSVLPPPLKNTEALIQFFSLP